MVVIGSDCEFLTFFLFGLVFRWERLERDSCDVLRACRQKRLKLKQSEGAEEEGGRRFLLGLYLCGGTGEEAGRPRGTGICLSADGSGRGGRSREGLASISLCRRRHSHHHVRRLRWMFVARPGEKREGGRQGVWGHCFHQALRSCSRCRLWP